MELSPLGPVTSAFIPSYVLSHFASPDDVVKWCCILGKFGGRWKFLIPIAILYFLQCQAYTHWIFIIHMGRKSPSELIFFNLLLWCALACVWVQAYGSMLSHWGICVEARGCLYLMSPGIIAKTLCSTSFYVGSMYSNHSSKPLKCINNSFQAPAPPLLIPNPEAISHW